ncbi:MAG: hypothetical protein HWN80_05820 [Candidatus Lokiarchaeota archaeon]|nr:hypothetical protein [Candidatus Lokiarchaeota archaeon]
MIPPSPDIGPVWQWRNIRVFWLLKCMVPTARMGMLLAVAVEDIRQLVA